MHIRIIFTIRMFNRYLTYYSPAIQFVIFCAIMFMSLMLGSFAIEILNEKLLGVSAAAIEDMKEIPPDLAFKLKLLNPVLLVVILLLPAYLFAYLAYPKPAVYLGLKPNINVSLIGLAVILLAVSFPFVTTLEEWSRMISFLNPKGNDSYDTLAKAMLKGSTISDLLINTLAICLVPAIAEELFFRGCLQQVMLNWLKNYPYFAMILVAVFFSAFHGQLSGFIPRVYLGFILGLAYYLTGNLWVPILMHFLNNFVSVFFSFLKEKNLVTFDINDNAGMPVYIGLLSLGLTIAVLYFMYKRKVTFIPIEVEKEINEEE